MSASDQWDAVDDYLDSLLVPTDPVLTAGNDRAAQAGLPAIQVTATQGKFLHLLARIVGAQRILEIGTLGGYSATWLARALPPGGRLVTLEIDPVHASIARATIDDAGLTSVVNVRVGPALDTLSLLESEGGGPFDLVFIDADKRSNADYVTWALRLTRPGSVIVVDNVVRDGRILDEDGDADIQGTRRVLELLANEPRLDATALQTVGAKGYDGFALALVTG